jgi:hypothetical protein
VGFIFFKIIKLLASPSPAYVKRLLIHDYLEKSVVIMMLYDPMEHVLVGPLVEECFWGTTSQVEDTKESGWLSWKNLFGDKSLEEEPKSAGWRIAIRRLKHSIKECEEILYQIDEIAEHLDENARVYATFAQEPSDIDGFGAELPQSTLKRSWSSVKRNMGVLGSSYSAASADIRNLVWEPFTRLKTNLNSKIDGYENKLTQLENAIYYWKREIHSTREHYEAKSIEADKEDGVVLSEETKSHHHHHVSPNQEDTMHQTHETDQYNSTTMVQLGPMKFSPKRLNELLGLMQHPVGGIPIDDIKGAIFGTHRYAFSGYDGGEWFLKRIEEIEDPSHAIVFGEFLLQKGLIEAIDTFTQEFQYAKTIYYEWKVWVTEDSDGFCSSFYSTRPLTKTRMAAAHADAAYKYAVAFGERSRLAYEEAAVDFLKDFRLMEIDRITFLKNTFKSFIDLMATLIHTSPEHYQSVLKSIEECNGIQDFSWVLSEYRTGWERPSTFIYISRYHPFSRGKKQKKPSSSLFFNFDDANGPLLFRSTVWC